MYFACACMHARMCKPSCQTLGVINLSRILFKETCSKYKVTKIRDYLIFAMSGQNQASFAKCYSKLLFGFDWLQRETEVYCRFKMIPTCRLHRRQGWDLEGCQVATIIATFDDMISPWQTGCSDWHGLQYTLWHMSISNQVFLQSRTWRKTLKVDPVLGIWVRIQYWYTKMGRLANKFKSIIYITNVYIW